MKGGSCQECKYVVPKGELAKSLDEAKELALNNTEFPGKLQSAKKLLLTKQGRDFLKERASQLRRQGRLYGRTLIIMNRAEFKAYNETKHVPRSVRFFSRKDKPPTKGLKQRAAEAIAHFKDSGDPKLRKFRWVTEYEDVGSVFERVLMDFEECLRSNQGLEKYLASAGKDGTLESYDLDDVATEITNMQDAAVEEGNEDDESWENDGSRDGYGALEQVEYGQNGEWLYDEDWEAEDYYEEEEPEDDGLTSEMREELARMEAANSAAASGAVGMNTGVRKGPASSADQRAGNRLRQVLPFASTAGLKPEEVAMQKKATECGDRMIGDKIVNGDPKYHKNMAEGEQILIALNDLGMGQATVTLTNKLLVGKSCHGVSAGQVGDLSDVEFTRYAQVVDSNGVEVGTSAAREQTRKYCKIQMNSDTPVRAASKMVKALRINSNQIVQYRVGEPALCAIDAMADPEKQKMQEQLLLDYMTNKIRQQTESAPIVQELVATVQECIKLDGDDSMTDKITKVAGHIVELTEQSTADFGTLQDFMNSSEPVAQCLRNCDPYKSSFLAMEKELSATLIGKPQTANLIVEADKPLTEQRCHWIINQLHIASLPSSGQQESANYAIQKLMAKAKELARAVGTANSLEAAQGFQDLMQKILVGIQKYLGLAEKAEVPDIKSLCRNNYDLVVETTALEKLFVDMNKAGKEKSGFPLLWSSVANIRNVKLSKGHDMDFMLSFLDAHLSVALTSSLLLGTKKAQKEATFMLNTVKVMLNMIPADQRKQKMVKVGPGKEQMRVWEGMLKLQKHLAEDAEPAAEGKSPAALVANAQALQSARLALTELKEEDKATLHMEDFENCVDVFRDPIAQAKEIWDGMSTAQCKQAFKTFGELVDVKGEDIPCWDNDVPTDGSATLEHVKQAAKKYGLLSKTTKEAIMAVWTGLTAGEKEYRA